MTYLLSPGQVWRSLFTRCRYRVLRDEGTAGVRVEALDVPFPGPESVLLPRLMFGPPQMQLEETAVAEDFDAYLNSIGDRNDL